MQFERLESRTLLSAYTVLDLGTLGGASSWAYGINDLGQVVGWSLDANGIERAFRTAPNSAINPATDNLGGFTATGRSRAYAINNAGQVVGDARDASNVSRAFRTAPNQPIQPTDSLGALGTGSSYAYDINNLGQVVGGSSVGNSYRAYLYSNGVMTDLGALKNNNYSEAWSINDAGVIVGWNSGNGADTSVRWTGGAISNIGSTLGSYNYAWAINSSGQIAGEGFDAGNTEYSAYLYSGGMWTALGVPAGASDTEAYGINDAGVVVGRINLGSGNLRAFVWSDGVMTDLNNLIPAGTGWTLQVARAINNNGQIAGYGLLNGQVRGFLLTPDAATNIQGTSGNDTIVLRRSASGNQIEVLLNGVPLPSVSATAVLNISGLAGDDLLTLDFINGSPIPSGGISFDGGVGKDTLRVQGQGQSFTVNASQMTHGSGVVALTAAEALDLDSGSFVIAADLGGAELAIGASASATVLASQQLASLSVAGTVLVGPGGDKLVTVDELGIAGGGRLDLADNFLRVNYSGASPQAAIRGWLASGFAGGGWTGNGISTSSAIAGQTALGHRDMGGYVLVRYTWYGDATLDGNVNFADLLRLSQNYGKAGMGWADGDFNYDGNVTFYDLLRLSQAYSRSSAQLWPAPSPSSMKLLKL